MIHKLGRHPAPRRTRSASPSPRPAPSSRLQAGHRLPHPSRAAGRGPGSASCAGSACPELFDAAGTLEAGAAGGEAEAALASDPRAARILEAGARPLRRRRDRFRDQPPARPRRRFAGLARNRRDHRKRARRGAGAGRAGRGGDARRSRPRRPRPRPEAAPESRRWKSSCLPPPRGHPPAASAGRPGGSTAWS